MAPFVDAMRSALQQRAWERSPPAETSGRTNTGSSPPSDRVPSAHGAGRSDAVDELLVDRQLVDMLVDMGFPRQRAAKAALETGNTGSAFSGACLTWLIWSVFWVVQGRLDIDAAKIAEEYLLICLSVHWLFDHAHILHGIHRPATLNVIMMLHLLYSNSVISPYLSSWVL